MHYLKTCKNANKIFIFAHFFQELFHFWFNTFFVKHQQNSTKPASPNGTLRVDLEVKQDIFNILRGTMQCLALKCHVRNIFQ